MHISPGFQGGVVNKSLTVIHGIIITRTRYSGKDIWLSKLMNKNPSIPGPPGQVLNKSQGL